MSEAKLEIKVYDRWVEVDWYIFRSWSGGRRMDGQTYIGPTALLGS